MSSTSEPTGTVSLTVTTADEGTEIYVVDGQMRLCAQGRRELVTSLPPGIYKVRILTAGIPEERLVALRDPNQPVTMRVPRQPFASPVPLSETTTTHEAHQALAEQVSGSASIQLGQGSQLFIMSRIWSPNQSRPAAAGQHPARGLTLRDPNRKVLVDLEAKSQTDLLNDPAAACTIELDPGFYLIDRKAPSQPHLVQAVFASPGWQTQVFLLERWQAPQPAEAVCPTNVAVLLSRLGQGFDPHNPNLRLDELARLGLTDARQVLSSETIEQITYGKFENPMLGLLGAHLLLLKSKPEELNAVLTRNLPVIVRNLRRLLGPDHPDVEALALKLDPPGNHLFQFPPMLRRSWNIVLEATVTRPELVPAHSLAEEVSDRLITSQPWLTWAGPEEPEPLVSGTPSFSIEEQQGLPLTEISVVEEALLNQVQQGRRDRAESFSVVSESRGLGSGELDDREIHRLVRTLGIPRNKIMSLLQRGLQGPSE